MSIRHVDTENGNALLRGVRALGEHTAAKIDEHRRALKRITLSRRRTAGIARAAFVRDGIRK